MDRTRIKAGGRRELAGPCYMGLGLIAGSILAVSLASGCSSNFTSCIETRTCPPDADSGGAGGVLDAEDGGASGAATEAGSGGAASTSESIQVLQVTPPDSTTDVERNQIVEVVFSSELDPDSVTPSTFEVSGPGGAVGGSLTVEGASVTFTPSTGWALRAQYTVTVGKGITALAGARLPEVQNFSFRSRDGVLGTHERLATSSNISLSVTGNRSGHVVAYWTDYTTKRTTSSLYDPRTRRWSNGALLEASGAFVGAPCMNENGDVFVVLSGDSGAWKRGDAGAWGDAIRDGVGGEPRACALGNDGTAMTVWEASTSEGFDVKAATLSAAGDWAPTTTLSAMSRRGPVAVLGEGFIVLYQDAETQEVFSRVLVDGAWRGTKRVTDAAANYFSLSAHGDAAIYTWNDPESRMRASLFDGVSWSTAELGAALGGTTSTLGPSGHLVAWTAAGSAYAARYDIDNGWQGSVELGPMVGEIIGPGVAVDDAGNGLIAWSDGANVSWRRSHGGNQWEDLQQIPNQDPSSVFVQGSALGDVMLVWQNELGIWASRFE